MGNPLILIDITKKKDVKILVLYDGIRKIGMHHHFPLPLKAASKLKVVEMMVLRYILFL